jgi:KUP system potassium uptake protein
MLYGDGAITPAISVLSALEGLKDPLPSFTPYVLPLSVLVPIALFAFQPQGTRRIGALFGPIMMVRFVTIGVLGIVGILQHPGVLAAVWRTAAWSPTSLLDHQPGILACPLGLGS